MIGAWRDDGEGRIEALFVGKPGPEGLAFAGTVEFGLDGHRRQLRQLIDLEARVRFIGWDAGVLREAIFEGVQLVEAPAP